MSYILKALRKSEQERLARQPETAAARILADQAEPRHKSSKLIILLIITNLILAACFFWFIRKEPASLLSVETKKPLVTEQTHVKPAIETLVKTDQAPKPGVKKSATESPSIADLAGSRNNQVSQPPGAKPVMEKEPALVQHKPAPITQEMEPKSIVSAQVEPALNVEKKLAAAPESKTVPFLSELPQEFRLTVPEFKVNVFVYSEQPAQRFVMVDMVKYTVGERIKESLTLKEIRLDSFVVEYNNRTFRIKRP
jgi:general secretion pathway protein B